uniref:IgGFc-binding protein N-terminal domain-containing protein n=1 Tax=Biomphalaria glabrata TaxID=6526 RepID=A0A2C9LZI0_BIOGL
MKFLIFLFLIFAVDKGVGNFVVNVVTDGSYSITVNGNIWLTSGYTFFNNNGKKYSTADYSLKLSRSWSTSGRDIIGEWQSTNFDYLAASLPVTTTIKTYNDPDIPIAIFTQEDMVRTPKVYIDKVRCQRETISPENSSTDAACCDAGGQILQPSKPATAIDDQIKKLPPSVIYSAASTTKTPVVFSDTDPLYLGPECTSVNFCLYYTSPILPLGDRNKVILLGETGKWVPLSVKRFSYIRRTMGDIVLTLQVSAHEIVIFSYMVDFGPVQTILCDNSQGSLPAFVSTISILQKQCTIV